MTGATVFGSGGPWARPRGQPLVRVQGRGLKCRGRRPCGPAPNSIVYAFFFVTFFSLTGIQLYYCNVKTVEWKIRGIGKSGECADNFLDEEDAFQVVIYSAVGLRTCGDQRDPDVMAQCRLFEKDVSE